MTTLINLFLEFFKIGLFSVGGGYAAMPFLYHLISVYGWYTSQQLSNMIAVSILTPGPVGINMATFAGFKTAGIAGAILASVSLVLPSFFIVIAISKVLTDLHDNFWIKSILYSLKPAGCGLLCSVGVDFFIQHVNSPSAFAVFILLFLLSFKFKKNPLFYFLFGGIIGIFLDLFNCL